MSNKLPYWLITWSGYLGPSGRFGVLLLMAALGVGAFSIAPMQRVSDAQEELRSAPVIILAAPAATDTALQDPLIKFYQGFPKAKAFVPQITRLYKFADNEGLRILGGTYQAETDVQHNILRYRLSLPMKGSYVQVRRFLRRTLADFPTMTVNRVVLQRSSIGEAGVEAQVELIWYLTDDGT